MEYTTNRTAYSITGMPIPTERMAYIAQAEMYSRTIKYARTASPSGSYVSSKGPPRVSRLE